MNKYLAICLLSVNSAMIMGMHLENTKIEVKIRKRVFRTVEALRTSDSIPIEGSGEFFIEKKKVESPVNTMKSSGSFLSDQSCSPPRREVFIEKLYDDGF
jgi:hypothetical protein